MRFTWILAVAALIACADSSAGRRTAIGNSAVGGDQLWYFRRTASIYAGQVSAYELRLTRAAASLTIHYFNEGSGGHPVTLSGKWSASDSLRFDPRTGSGEPRVTCKRHRDSVHVAGATTTFDCRRKPAVVWSGPETQVETWSCNPENEEGVAYYFDSEGTLGPSPGIEEVTIGTCWFYDMGQGYSGLRKIELPVGSRRP